MTVAATAGARYTMVDRKEAYGTGRDTILLVLLVQWLITQKLPTNVLVAIRGAKGVETLFWLFSHQLSQAKPERVSTRVMAKKKERCTAGQPTPERRAHDENRENKC